MTEQDVRAGAGIYSKPVLKIYDLFVVQFSSTFAWRCTSDRMLAQYKANVGTRHLDVGPGTGWYLARASFPADADVTLMDLNNNSLDAASQRLDGITHHRLVANVLEPLPAQIGPFDSIGVNYLLHCVPGAWTEKGVAFAYLAAQLADDGTLFGSTVLGSGVQHNRLGRVLMALYNRKGIFHNRRDDAAGLQRALEQSFAQVNVKVVGAAAVFSAREPLARS